MKEGGACVWVGVCRYGYLTSTQAKIIAVLTEGEPVRDADLRAVRAWGTDGASFWRGGPELLCLPGCRCAACLWPPQVLVGVHQLYVNYVQCPFAPLSGKINSDRFRHGVGRQVNLYNGVN